MDTNTHNARLDAPARRAARRDGGLDAPRGVEKELMAAFAKQHRPHALVPAHRRPQWALAGAGGLRRAGRGR